MAKTQALNSSDLVPTRVRSASRTRQRGVVPSAELIPMQFRMPPDFVWAFKQAAVNDRMRLNEYLRACFEAKQQSSKARKSEP